MDFAQLTDLTAQARALPIARRYGRVVGVNGLVVQVAGLDKVALGNRATIVGQRGVPDLPAEVIGYGQGTTMLMPFGPMAGIGAGQQVYPDEAPPSQRINASWLGRVVNGLGQPLDGGGPLAPLGGSIMPLRAPPPPAFTRQPVGPMLDTGVRVLNTLLPLCEGQRLGIFAGSGVGKSVLMGMLARHSKADVNVIGLIGERGKELNEFLHEQLGPEGLARSVVITATSDETPLLKRQAAYLTLAVAEFFRDCGYKVLLMMDSVTRLAQAQREIGLAANEPPTTRGYTPSVFAELPRLLERAGPGTGTGNISAIFTVLVEGSDMEEPVADAVRGILDGHIVLSRELAERGHFPAVDVLQSVSRMVPKCLAAEQIPLVQRTRRLLATYNDMAELIRLGAYTQGADASVDEAIALTPSLEKVLQQLPTEGASQAESWAALGQVFQG